MMRTVLRRAALVLAAVLAVALLPAVAAAVAAPAAFAAHYAPGPERAVPAVAPAPHDPTKPTAVVVVGDLGAEVSDVLPPYEMLASTGRLNVYTVASQRVPVPLSGGLDLVPDLTFDELTAHIGGVADLVVVPALPDVGEPSTAPVTDWLRSQSDGGAMILSICNGAGVLASAGLLDGRPAAAHWMRIGRLESQYPQVGWVRAQRFIDDGDVVTTAGILSGVDGTLHVVERLFGSAAAATAATAIGWRHYGAGLPAYTGPGVPDPAGIINAGYRFDPATIGVALTEGVGETELASVFAAHGTWTLAARTLAVTADGGPVRSRHGLTFLPRADLAGAAPQLDRLIVPGAAAAAQGVAVPAGLEPEYLHDGSMFAYDAAVTDVARTMDVATAEWTAKVLELPTDGLTLDGPAWPWAPTAVLGGLALLGAAVFAGVLRWAGRRRRDPHHAGAAIA